MASSRTSSRRTHPFVLVANTILATSLALLLVVNFTGGETKISKPPQHRYAVADPQFERALGVLLGPPIVAGNRYQALYNGEQIFPAMLEAIRAAQKSITFETYIYWSGDIGRAFADALTERARAGVAVHVLLDWVGSAKIDQAFIDEMTQAGVQVHKFHKPTWYQLGRLNNRTHRKLLVVDGRVGFTGGVGIAAEWTGNAQDPEHWRDTHFRIEGPAVAQVQAVFMDNWIKVSGEALHDERYFPSLEPVAGGGNSKNNAGTDEASAGSEKGEKRQGGEGTGGSKREGLAQMFSSSPQGGAESMQLMYLLSITAATKTIDLSSAYFVPDELTQQALIDAMQRGVRLRILTPGEHMDAQTVRLASRAGWKALLAAGAQISEYQPTMFHCKVFTVDGLLVSVGSTNFDNRSFRLNDEANLNIYDAAFAAEQTAVFEADLKRSKRFTLAQWEERSLWEKTKEQVAALIAAQL
ncbi:MAG: phospholipase D-like domain-containing protein [Variovorax sp.]